jgi:hypothetical protein
MIGRAALSLLIAAAAAVPARAQELTQARTFVEGLYAAYRRSPGPDYVGRQAAKVFSPALVALMRRDAARTPEGEVGTLDGDPICNCQDYEIRGVNVTVKPAGPGKAVAVARFRNLGQPQTVTLDLVAVGHAWRVDDVHAEGTPSLVALFRRAAR